MNTIVKPRFKPLIFVVMLFWSAVVHASTLAGTYTIPGTVNSVAVNNLTDLSNLLNTGADTINGTVVFEFTMAYNGATETLPIVFNAFKGTGNVIIRPAASVNTPLVTGGGPGAVALVDFNGGHHFTIDGRPGGTGNTGYWTFQNTTVNSPYPTFLFLNGAAHDTLTYLTVLSSAGPNTFSISFGTSNVSGGNSYNVISHNNISSYTAGYAYNAFASGGSSGIYTNTDNSFINNHVYNLQPTNSSAGMVSVTTGSNWVISGNSFYNNVVGGVPSTQPIRCISFSANTTGNHITGNYIGGQQPLCGGGAWQVGSYGTGTTAASADFVGIHLSGSAVVSDNVIANVVMNNVNESAKFYGIFVFGGSDTITNNRIGGPGDSIVNGLYGTVAGIISQSTSGSVISNNTICNLVSDGRSYVNGISHTVLSYTSGIHLTNTTQTRAFYIGNNSIYNLKRNNSGALEGNITGIYTAIKDTQFIINNSIHHLLQTGLRSRNDIRGIYVSSGSGNITLIDRNYIYGLHTNTTGGPNLYTTITGISSEQNYNSRLTCTNNAIALGFAEDGSSLQNVNIWGIYTYLTQFTSSAEVKLLHNTVYIGGTDSNVYNNNHSSVAMYRYVPSTLYADPLIMRNNLFVNQRGVTAGTGKNHGLFFSNIAQIVSDYNDIYGTGSSWVLIKVGTSTYSSLPSYSAANIGLETNSISANPLFVSPHTFVPGLHLQTNSPADQAGTATATLATDIEGNVRANFTPVDLGAFVSCNGNVTAAISLAASQAAACAGTDITFTATPTNGGSTPIYNFYKNDTLMQSGTADSYTLNTLAPGDSVKATLVSSLGCVAPAIATSNTLSVNIVPGTLVPVVNIYTADTITCSNAVTNFTAQVTNAGTQPTYQWKRNGITEATTPAYSAATINEGDVVSCVVTSSDPCANFDSAVSNAITMHIAAQVVPTVSVQGPAIPYVCPNSLVTFQAVGAHHGNQPIYTWWKNGNVQPGSAGTQTFTASGPLTIRCQVSSSLSCALPGSAYSETDTVYTVPSQSLPLAVDVCPGDSFTYLGHTYTQPGNYTDTISATGSCALTLAISLSYSNPVHRTRTAQICPGSAYNFNGSNLTAPGVYTDTVTGLNSCDSVIELTLTLASSAVPDISLQSGTTLSTTALGTYQWLLNNQPVNGATASAYTATQNGVYRVVVTNAAGCADTSAPFPVINVSVYTVQSNAAIQLFPNPTSGSLQLHAQGVQGVSLGIKLFDTYGRMISNLTEPIVNGMCATAMDMNAYTNGIYFVQLSAANLQVCKRVELLK